MENVSSKIPTVNLCDSTLDESISMYYSFNSTIADRTMEAENMPEIYEKANAEIRTVIKKVSGLTPIRGAPKNILQDFKTFSSTPTRKGSIEEIAESMAALGVAPLESIKEVTSEKSEHIEICIEETASGSESGEIKDYDSNKNGNPESDSNENLYFFHNNTKNQQEKTVEERQINLTSGGGSGNAVSIVIVDTSSSFSGQGNSSDEEKLALSEEDNKENICPDKDGKGTPSKDLKSCLKDGENVSIISISDSFPDCENKENQSNIPNVSKVIAKHHKLGQILEEPEKKEKLNKGGNVPSAPVAQRRISSIAMRRSILPSDPDLARNKPSRIVDKKRASMAATSKMSPSQFVTQIPRLLTKIMQGKVDPPSSQHTSTGDQKEAVVKKPESNRKTMLSTASTKAEKRKTIGQPLNKRLSMVKREVTANHERSPKKLRRSGILKTTLNSPANRRNSFRRSIARPQSQIVSSQKSRASLFPTTSTAAKNKIPLRRLQSVLEKEATKIPSKEEKNEQHTKNAAPISRENHACDKCSRTFRLFSSLDAHKKTHLAAVTSVPMCKYCDKKFAISKALENHLLEKCPKIPTAEKKKLLAAAPTVPAERLPRGSGFNAHKKSPNHRSTSASICSIDSTASINNKTDSSPDSESMPPPPPSSSKSKKRVPEAHSGVYRTPSKPVMCHPCKKTFDNVFNYTEHVLSHSSSGLDS